MVLDPTGITARQITQLGNQIDLSLNVGRIVAFDSARQTCTVRSAAPNITFADGAVRYRDHQNILIPALAYSSDHTWFVNLPNERLVDDEANALGPTVLYVRNRGSDGGYVVAELPLGESGAVREWERLMGDALLTNASAVNIHSTATAGGTRITDIPHDVDGYILDQGGQLKVIEMDTRAGSSRVVMRCFIQELSGDLGTGVLPLVGYFRLERAGVTFEFVTDNPRVFYAFSYAPLPSILEGVINVLPGAIGDFLDSNSPHLHTLKRTTLGVDLIEIGDSYASPRQDESITETVVRYMFRELSMPFTKEDEDELVSGIFQGEVRGDSFFVPNRFVPRGFNRTRRPYDEDDIGVQKIGNDVRLSWSNAALGGSPIFVYARRGNLQRAESTGRFNYWVADWQDGRYRQGLETYGLQTVVSSGSSALVGGLGVGRYRFKLVVFGANAASDRVLYIDYDNGNLPLNPPENFAASFTGTPPGYTDYGYSLTWDAVSGVRGYQIQYRKVGETNWRDIQNLDVFAPAVSYTWGGAAREFGITMQFRIRAGNNAGQYGRWAQTEAVVPSE